MSSQIKKVETITIAEVVYMAYFFFMFGARASGLYEGMLIYNITIVAGMLLFGTKVLLTKHTIFEYICIGSLGLLSMIVYYNTGEKGFLFYVTMMLGLKCVSVERVMKWATIILGSFFSILVLVTTSGLVQDIYYTKDRAFFGMVMRRSLGYPYPNTLFTTYIVLMVLIMYVLGRLEKKKLIAVSLIQFAGALYMFLYSCSNTGIIVSTVFLIINFYFQTRKTITKAEKVLVQLVYPGCILFSVVGPMISGGKIFELLDKVLHNRWNYSRYYLTNEPITLLGQRFKPAPNTNYLIDSSFLYSFLQIGLIAFAVITILNIVMIHDYAKREKRIELAIIISFCILGLSDPFLYNLSYKNLLFLFIGEYFYRSLDKIQKKLPDCMRYEIQWLKLGTREIGLDCLCPTKIRDVFFMVGNALALRYVYYTMLYFVSGTVIAVSYYLITDFKMVIATVDSVAKWEYIRAGVSLGVWGGIVTVLLSVFKENSKKIRNYKSNVKGDV